MSKRIQREKRTVSLMIGMYCHQHHISNNGLCPACLALKEYAEARADFCQFGDNKPVCVKCPVHCYKPEKRENIKTVMRYAGPKMIHKYPYLAVMHIMDKRKPFSDQNIMKK